MDRIKCLRSGAALMAEFERVLGDASGTPDDSELLALGMKAEGAPSEEEEASANAALSELERWKLRDVLGQLDSPAKPSERRARAVHSLVQAAGRAFWEDLDDAGSCARIEQALALLEPPPSLRSQVLQVVRTGLRTIRGAHQKPNWVEEAAGSLAEQLAKVAPEFAKLDLGVVATDLRRTHTKSPGGEGNWGPFRLAAELSCACRAFGDEDVDKARKAFLAADRVTV